jgi:large subunit ribosomal protein L9
VRVILNQDVAGLGKAGQTVEAADGYARNFLLPRGLAEPYSPGAERRWQEEARQRVRHEARERASAEAIHQRLDGARVVVRVRSGQSGRTFGAVTARDVVEAVRRQFGVEVDKRRVAIGRPIKSLGEHPVRVELHPGMVANVVVAVEEDVP